VVDRAVSARMVRGVHVRIWHKDLCCWRTVLSKVCREFRDV
jgi:hypothetical protein